MIGRLKGTVEVIDEDAVLLDVNGVGYEVFGAARLLQQLSIGAAATLAIETIVREDFIKLYGFSDTEERRCFRLLQTVQGVGAKHALAILHVLAPDELRAAVVAGDATAVARAHGVGRKIAQRIVAELASKIAGVAGERPGATLAREPATGVTRDAGAMGARADAVSALTNLGYDGLEARRAVAEVATGLNGQADTSALIRDALKVLAPA